MRRRVGLHAERPNAGFDCCATLHTPARRRVSTAAPRRLAAANDLAHAGDELGLRRGELRALAQLDIVGAALARLGELRAEAKVADRHQRAARRGALVGALNDSAQAAADLGSLAAHSLIMSDKVDTLPGPSGKPLAQAHAA